MATSQKRANQWHRWSQEVIPSLLIPYLSYIQRTSALLCIAGCRTQSITVACMHFNVLKEIDIIACPCFPAPLQLLCRGLFPCAPVAPSLAVDLCILEFVHLLFVCQSPNQTVWCDAVETFLDGMGYKFTDHHGSRSHFYSHHGRSKGPGIEYLRSRCLLCFGGNTYHGSDLHSIPDATICIDACFTQKCLTNPHGADSIDPPNPTPTFFLSDDDVKAMEDFVQSCRGERHQVRVSRAEGDEDHYEEGICREFFVAADEKHEKASTRFFTDTGLMALLCRHDRVLWLANFTSAGEKQHYALALLDRFCRKWKLLDNNTLSRISFAVVVFHAYGHQWPCQIVYHLRKREGFGLSLKQLISSLQVSGFHQCLFVLDVQICHLDTKSIQGYGHWLHRRWIHCQTKKNVALDSLLDLDIDEDMLRAQWKAQIAHKTRPTPRQSRNKAAEVITTILVLEKTLDAYETSVHELEMQLNCHKAALGTQAKADLEKMKNDTYLTVCLNACAVKIRIRDRLRQHKFELERLERLYRATINAEHKIHASTQYSIKHWEPGILKLVSTYNGLCTQLRSLILLRWYRRAPPSAVPPCPIICEGIFLLDVNDEIWQDIGLDEDGINPPAWLSDEATRSGIRLQLEVDRCIEEETRLMRERTVMQEWMSAEWEAIQTVLRDVADDIVVSFHMRAHADKLLHIYIPCAWPVKSWDQYEDNDESVGEQEESDKDSDLAYYEVGDDELMDAIEEVALADEYRYQDEDIDDDIEDTFMPSSPTKSSLKKGVACNTDTLT
ncbi:hypothetical protein BDR06DRAFT_984071 [Suillus hirtellus]|nr:hypothetical protein BDR06DRAFT_984071 [Suillus hirtellus]